VISYGTKVAGRKNLGLGVAVAKKEACPREKTGRPTIFLRMQRMKGRTSAIINTLIGAETLPWVKSGPEKGKGTPIKKRRAWRRSPAKAEPGKESRGKGKGLGTDNHRVKGYGGTAGKK